MAEEEVKERKDVVPSQYREKYRDQGGTCGDFIATELSKVAKDGVTSLSAIKTENDIPVGKWGAMNPGMQRMNLANTLRASYLRGDTVKILGREYNVKHQAQDFPGGGLDAVKNNDTSLAKLATFLELQTNERTLKALSKVFFPPENKSAVLKAQREDAKLAKEAAKTLAKLEKAVTTAETAHGKALTAHGKSETASTAASGKVTEAEAAAAAADEAGKAKADKAVVAAKAAATKANTKADESKAKLDEAAKALDDAKAAVVAATTPVSTEEDGKAE